MKGSATPLTRAEGPSYLADTRVTNGCAGCMRATSFSERRGASAGVM